MHSPARQEMTITAFIFTAIALAAAAQLGFIASASIASVLAVTLGGVAYFNNRQTTEIACPTKR
jgi:hypothetical protein